VERVVQTTIVGKLTAKVEEITPAEKNDLGMSFLSGVRV
jgi:hypothetical protein